MISKFFVWLLFANNAAVGDGFSSHTTVNQRKRPNHRTPRIQRHAALSFDDERPKRHHPSYDPTTNWRSDWGVTHIPTEIRIPFPSSLDSLVDSVVTTIHTELACAGEVDPTIAHNAFYGDRLLGRRPARYPSRDRGRIGIEIEGEDLILVALKSAYRLCQNNVPVAVYLNTLNEALIASRYLQLIKSKYGDKVHTTTPYDLIQVCALSSASIPENMSHITKWKKKVRVDTEKSVIDTSQGYIIVVQPSGSIEGLQRLAAKATLAALPVVLLSPRLNYRTPTSWDQSGFQQSAFYGGNEPPAGPTPWLMRDFTPPIMSWILMEDFSLWQTIRHKSHSWDLFAHTDKGSYEYMASTKKVAGRPTRWLLNRLRREDSLGKD